MKAAVVPAPGTIEIRDIPAPQYGEYDVRVQQISCSLCNGTDLKILHGKYAGIYKFPLALGHEAVGRVIEKGSRVRNFDIGDIVVHSQIAPAGTALTPPGGEVLYAGSGGFAEYGVATDWRAMFADGIGPQDPRFQPLHYAQLALPRELSSVYAPMIITWREVVGAIKQFGFAANNSVVVYGDGPVGLSVVLLGKLLGLHPIVLCGHHTERFDLAGRLGADLTIDTLSQNPKQAMSGLLPGGCDFVVDAVGKPEIVNDCLELIKSDGKICIYGLRNMEALTLDVQWGKSPRNFTLQFYRQQSLFEEGAAHQQVVNLMQAGCIDPKDFISHVLPLEKIEEGVRLLQSREALKVVITLGAE